MTMGEATKTVQNVEEIMRSARAEGAAVKGQFSIDNRAAREKMAAFRLADPWAYGVELFLAAVRKGATWVEMQIASGTFEMAFDGSAFTADDFENMYGNWFAEDNSDPDCRASGQLGLALNTVAALNPDRVEVTSGDGERGVRLLIRPGKEEIIEFMDEAPTVTRIQVRPDVPFGENISPGAGAARTIELLEKSCCHAACDLTINGKAHSFGFSLPKATVRLPFEDGQLCGVALVSPLCGSGGIRLLVEDIVVETMPLPKDCDGVVVLIRDERLRRDFSSKKIIRNAVFETAVRRAEETAAAAVLQIPNKRVQLSVFDGGYGGTPASLIKVVAAAGFENGRMIPMDLSTFAPPSLYLTSESAAADALFQRLKWMPRPLVMAAWFAVLLLTLVLIIRIKDSSGFGVSFLLVVFMVVLLTMLLTVSAFDRTGARRALRRRTVRLDTDRRSLEDALKNQGIAPSGMMTIGKFFAGKPSGTLRIKGEIAAKSRDPVRDRDVFADLWTVTKTKTLRFQASRLFSLHPDGYDNTTVTVDLSDGVWIEGPYHREVDLPVLVPVVKRNVAEWAKKQKVYGFFVGGKQFRNDAVDALNAVFKSAQGIVLQEGDRVEIIAPSGTWTCDLDGSRQLKLKGKAAQPLLVRKLSHQEIS